MVAQRVVLLELGGAPGGGVEGDRVTPVVAVQCPPLASLLAAGIDFGEHAVERGVACVAQPDDRGIDRQSPYSFLVFEDEPTSDA